MGTWVFSDIEIKKKKETNKLKKFKELKEYKFTK